MSGVDFSDREAALVWLEMQSVEVSSAIASRAALRVCANICRSDEKIFSLSALAVFRATLTTAVRGSGRTGDADWLRFAGKSAKSAAFFAEDAFAFSPEDAAAYPTAHRAAKSAANSAAKSADAAAYSYKSAAYSAANSAAGSAAASAADSAARSTAYSATTSDSENGTITNYLIPLWHDIEVPEAIAENHNTFLEMLQADRAIWGFWHDWYLAMWEGRFTDWDLAIEVAKIPDEVWEQGAEAVADAIRGIEARRASALPRPENVPELERSTLLKYVEKLLANPDMTALAADGAAQTLRQAISTYLRDAPANALPVELAHLEGLPALFDGIATLAKSGGKSEAKARQMADQIEALNAKVARLEAQLKEARTKTVNGLFTQNMLRAAGTAFGAGAVATLGLSVRHFFGEWPDEFTLENLRGFLIDLQTATPIDGNTASLPPATDV